MGVERDGEGMQFSASDAIRAGSVNNAELRERDVSVGTQGCTRTNGCASWGRIDGGDHQRCGASAGAAAASAATLAWAQGTWAGGWVKSLVTNRFGSGGERDGRSDLGSGQRAGWWDAVHRDVHPKPLTYDEVTQSGIAGRGDQDGGSTAEVSGPVMDYWWNYFYSKKDIETGWSSGRVTSRGHPVDRKAHGGVPIIEYYLEQFAAAEKSGGTRLLDYLDLHTYFVADDPQNPGTSLGLAPAGNRAEQQARLDSTRALWDATYTDPNYPQANYRDRCELHRQLQVPLQAPQVIPMMQGWVAGIIRGRTGDHGV